MKQLSKFKRVRFKLKQRNKTNKMRLSVYRSEANIYAQIIDVKGNVIVCGSSTEKNFNNAGYNVAGARAVGQLIGQRAKEKGIDSVIFDRGGYVYHGRVEAVAEGAREYIKI